MWQMNLSPMQSKMAIEGLVFKLGRKFDASFVFDGHSTINVRSSQKEFENISKALSTGLAFGDIIIKLARKSSKSDRELITRVKHGDLEYNISFLLNRVLNEDVTPMNESDNVEDKMYTVGEFLNESQGVEVVWEYNGNVWVNGENIVRMSINEWYKVPLLTKDSITGIKNKLVAKYKYKDGQFDDKFFDVPLDVIISFIKEYETLLSKARIKFTSNLKNISGSLNESVGVFGPVPTQFLTTPSHLL